MGVDGFLSVTFVLLNYILLKPSNISCCLHEGKLIEIATVPSRRQEWHILK